MPDPMAGLPPRLLRRPTPARFLEISTVPSRSIEPMAPAPVYRKVGGPCRLWLSRICSMVRGSARASRQRTRRHSAFFPARRLTAAERGAR